MKFGDAHNTLDTFTGAVAYHLREQFPDCSFKPTICEKPTHSYKAILVTPNNCPTSFYIPIEDLYARFNGGNGMDLVAETAMLVSQHVIQARSLSVDDLTDYEKMKSKLVLQLVNTEANKDYLQNVPHKEFGDLSIIYRVEVSADKDGSQSFVVNNDYLKRAGISLEQLHQDAITSAPIVRPLMARSLAEIVAEHTGMPIETVGNLPLNVVTTASSAHGAAAMVYPDFADKITEMFGDGASVYILPSSIHEILVMKDTGDVDIAHLKEMVETVNTNEVAPADRLSNNVYRFNGETKQIEIAKENKEPSLYVQSVLNRSEQQQDQTQNRNRGQGRD